MRKPVLAVVAIAALALLAGSPWVLGALAQQRVTAGIERLDAESDIDAAIVDYARGFGTSTATIELSLPAAATDPSALPSDAPPAARLLLAAMAEPIRLLVTVRHGPILLADGAPVGLAASTIQIDPATPGYRELLEELGIPYIFELRTVTGFTGQSDWVNEVPAFALERDDLIVRFSGSNSNGTYDAATRRLVGQGEAASLHTEAEDTIVDLEQIAFDTDSTYYSEALRIGYVDASIARIAVASPGDSFALDGFGARFDIDLDDSGERATMVGAYTLARLSDGAELDLSDVAITATARQVDIAALSAYYTSMQESGMQNDASAPLSLTAEDALYDLVTASPILELEPLRLSWQGEPLEARVRMDVDATNLPPRSNFNALVLALEGVVGIDASVEMSDALARTIAARGIAFQIRRNAANDGVFMTDDEVETIAQAQAALALAALVAQGMLTASDSGYATTAQFRQGELTVNGTPIPLGLL